MKPVEIGTFAEYRFVSRLRAGGEGRACFLVKQADMEKNCYQSDVWLLEGNEARPLTTGGNIEAFWWLSDTEILFSRVAKPEDKERQERGLPLTVLHRLSVAEAGEATPFLRLELDVQDLAPLPDGRLLLVATFDEAVQQALADAEGSDEKAAELLKRRGVCETFTELPFWRNGAGFASGRCSRLYLWEAGRLTPLTDAKTHVEALRLSATGKRAFFAAKRYDTVEPIANRLWMLELDDLTLRDISLADPFDHNEFAVLDDETLFVCGSDMAAYGVNQNGNFYRLPVGGLPAPLHEGGQYSVGDGVACDMKLSAAARLAAVGRDVLWNATLDENSQLMRMDADTGEVEALTTKPGAVMEFAQSGERLIFTALRGLAGPEVYELLPSGEERRITHFNDGMAETYAFSQPEPVSFINGEGVEIRGFVLPPQNFAAGRNYPAVLHIHGGPKAVFGTVLFHEMQLWAARGYAVLFANPTGGDGRGNAFADIRGRYGMIDYEDLMTFVDTCLAKYDWIDPARLGVAGGSYGGFMTNWIIGHTERFAAAVSQRGIANWATMATTTDIGFFFAPDQIGAGLAEDPALLWEASPLKYAHYATTPTLFIHSDEDYRCWMVESLQMYTALMQAGVKTKLCLFKGENHELSRSGRPQQRMRRLTEIVDWFDGILQP